nr:copia protein [Tanacetum cinerariifolium]
MTGDDNCDGNQPKTFNLSPPILPPTQQIPHIVSSIKLPILKKGKYDIWATKMGHYLSHTNYLIWQVIQNGNGPVSVTTNTNEGLHKGYDRFQTLLSQLEIHGAGVSHENASQKFLRSQPSSWSQVALIMRTKPGLDTLSFDDLYNNLRVFEGDVKCTTASSSSSNTQNVAFVSADNISNTNDINDDYLEEMDLKWQVAMISMRIKKFHRRTSIKLQFDTRDPVGFNKTKVKCFNYHKMGHFARDCRAKGNQDSRRKDDGYNGNKARDNGRRPAYQDDSKALVTIDGEDIDWSGHVKEDTQNYAMMAYSSNNSSSEYESVFMNKECDLKDTPVNDRYAKGIHAVPPPMIGNYMPSGPDVEIDYSKFTNGPKQTSADESDSKPVEYAFSKSDSSVETTTSMPAPVDNAPKIVCKPKVEKIKETDTPNHIPKIEKQDRHTHTKKGLGYAFTRKACFVCSSFSHLIKDCDFHEKRMEKQAVLTKSKDKVTGQSDSRPVWNNVQRVNHQHKFVPSVLLTKTGKFPVTAATQNFSREAASTSTASKVNTARPFDDPHKALKDKEIVDSGCSRHMTRIKAHLVDYQEFKGGDWHLFIAFNSQIIQTISGGYVAFGGSNGRITSKGKIKNKVLFTNTDCLVLSLDFKLPNENQDETTPILKDFIRQADNQFNQKVKTIRSDNETEFKNHELIELCGLKGIKMEYSNARTPQQNKVAKRQNRNLIKAARTMLADSFLPTTFWAEAVNTAFCVLNREDLEKLKRQEKEANDAARKEATHENQNANTNSTNLLNAVSIPISIAGPLITLNDDEPSYPDDPLMPHLEDIYASPNLPFGKKAIGTKWVYRNKKDEMGVVVRNKACLVAQGHRKEKGIDYDEVFSPVARIEAISIFLAFAFYMGFIVYQMHVKSAFLYGTIDEEVYVTQPSVFVDPKFPNKVYKVVKALYGLHQAPRACVKTASTPIETQKPIVKDEEAADVVVHLYRSMIGSIIPNGDALRKCILSGPYKPTTVLVQAVAATDDSLAILEHATVETPMNMSLENKAHFQAKKEAIHLILTGIGNEIYSTVDACQTAQEMREAIKRLQQGKKIAKPITPPSETASKEDSDPEQAKRDKDMQKNLALTAKTMNVARARENVGSPVVQQSGIQCFNCKEFGHFAKECRKPKRVKDFAYQKEKMLSCGTGNSFTYDTISESYDEVPNPPPQCHFNVYLCQICESNSHYGYECSQRVPLVYEPEPCYIPNFNDNCYSHDLPGVNPLIDHHCCHECGNSLNDFFCYQCTCEFYGNGAHVGYNCPAQVPSLKTLPCFPQQYPCCEDCGVTHKPYQCQPNNHDYYHEQNSCYDSDSFGFDHCQPLQYTVNHPIFNAHNDLLNANNDLLNSQNEITIAQNKLMDQLTSMCAMIPVCYDDDDDYNSAITPNEPVNSLSMRDEHLNTISTTKSDEFIKSCVENLVPNPSESEGENRFDLPSCFTTFSNILFDADGESDSSNYQSCSDEDFQEEIYSNPLFEEEIISIKIDQHHFDAESNLVESLLNRDSSIISSSSKIDSLLDEFAGELILLKSIPPGIDEIDCYSEKDIHLIERLLYENSSTRPPEEFVSKNSNANIESFSPSPIPVKDSDSYMEEIDLSFNPDNPMPPSIEDDDDDSEGDTLSLERLLHDDPIPLLDTLDFSYEVRVFLPFFTYPVTSSILHSFGNEDTIFDPGIAINHFYSF